MAATGPRQHAVRQGLSRPGVDRKLDVPRIARVIKSVKPDLVALQEVDNKAGRSGRVDQATELARLTGMRPVFGANIPLQGGHSGNAILSRFPSGASCDCGSA